MSCNLLTAPARLVVGCGKELGIPQFDGVVVGMSDGPLWGELVELLDTISTNDHIRLTDRVSLVMERGE